MNDTSTPIEVGDFLAWPPSRYLAAGWFADPAGTTPRPELQGAYALASAYLFLTQAATADEAMSFAAELQRVATATPSAGPAMQAAINGLAERLLQPPFGGKLVFYDFFRECAAFLKAAPDLAALAGHAAAIADRLALMAALQAADPANVPPGHF